MRTCTSKHLIWMLYAKQQLLDSSDNSSLAPSSPGPAAVPEVAEIQQQNGWTSFSQEVPSPYINLIKAWDQILCFETWKWQAEHHHLILYHLSHFSTCRKWLLKTAEHPHLSCATCLFLSLQDLDDFEKCDVASNHNPAGLGICLASLFLQSLFVNIIWYCTPCVLCWTLTTKTRTHNTWKSSRIYVLLFDSRFKTQLTYHQA